MSKIDDFSQEQGETWVERPGSDADTNIEYLQKLIIFTKKTTDSDMDWNKEFSDAKINSQQCWKEDYDNLALWYHDIFWKKAKIITSLLVYTCVEF